MQVAEAQRGQVDQQLSEIKLWVHVVAAASRGEAGEDGGSTSAAGIANEEA